MNEEKALADFLLDIQSLDGLSKWSGKFNLFDTLKLTKSEIRHSDMLAWLLTPNGNHGLGDCVLRRLLQSLLRESQMEQKNILDILLMDLDSFEVLREYTRENRRMDILVISRKEKRLICIENKIESGEHDNQLAEYSKRLKAEYPDYIMMLVYLTPDGVLPEDEKDQEVWQPLSYQEIIHIIEGAMSENSLDSDVEVVIRHYIDMVRRYIVGDKELERQCKAIYMKHQAALDLIFEYRSNGAKQAAEKIREWCRNKAQSGEIEFDEKAAETKVGEIAFTTAYMNSQLPGFEEAKSGWNDKNMYRYAIFNKGDGEKFSVRLIVAGRNLNDMQKQRCIELCNRIAEGKQREEGWQWWTLKTLKTFSVKDELSEEEYQAKLFEGLDKALEEINKFEKHLGKS